MAISGERGDLLVSALGKGNFIVHGLHQKNQLHIFELAHAEPIIQILNLAKLRNKYFATRCSDGHVNIWSATNHPERLFHLFNIDADEKALAHLQPEPEVEEVVVVAKKTIITDPDHPDYDPDLLEEEAEEAVAEEEEPAKKKKPEPTAPVAPVLIGRPRPSVHDTMIELTMWKGLQLSSSTMICMSNWTECLTTVCEVELKTRKRVLKRSFKNNNSPTILFQIDEDYLLVGTAGGKIEMWNIETEKIAKFHDAHDESPLGISSIVELKEPSYCLRGERTAADPEVRYIVTSCFDRPEFKMWKMQVAGPKGRPEFTFHLQIQTSLTGISRILQSTPSQLVCVDNTQCLKFYDFVDRVEQRKKESFEEKVAKFQDQIFQTFRKMDSDASGNLDIDECEDLADLLLKQRDDYAALSDISKKEMREVVFNEMDLDGSGYVSYHELKVYLTRKLTQQNKQSQAAATTSDA